MSQKKVERWGPDEGWDTTGRSSVLVPVAGAGPCAGHASTKVVVLRGIRACPAKVVFDPGPGFMNSPSIISPTCWLILAKAEMEPRLTWPVTRTGCRCRNQGVGGVFLGCGDHEGGLKQCIVCQYISMRNTIRRVSRRWRGVDQMKAWTQLASANSWSLELVPGHVLAMLGQRWESCTALAPVWPKSSLIRDQDQ